jgi:hypothetical protein
MESENSASEQKQYTHRMVFLAGQSYNPDHIVKVDLRKAPEFATIHHTTGVDEYAGKDASDLAAFFGPPAQAAPPAAAPTPAKTRRQKA